MLNTHQLNVFTVAAETLNFTQTAKKLHLTQSSVSQHIKALETQLETDLFIRRGRSIELTDAGEILLPLAREIVEGSMRAMEKMELLKEEVYGQLIIGCNSAPGKYVLPLLLAEFHKLYPMVKIACQVMPRRQVLQQLNEGEVHFAMMHLDQTDDYTADFHLYIREPVSFIVPPDHPWRNVESIHPRELLSQMFIMREEHSGTYFSVQKALEDVGIDIAKLDTFLTMGTSEAIALAVKKGLGVGFVSRMIMSKICPGQVFPVEIRGVNIFQDIYIGRQTARPIPATQAAFWEFLHTPEVSQRLAQETGAEVRELSALVKRP